MEKKQQLRDEEAQTSAMNSAILNALAILVESNNETKEIVVNAFEQSMAHMDCGHEFCENVGHVMAQYIADEEWQGLGNFLDYDHLDF